MGNIKQINIKNRTHYFFNNMINIEDFYINLLKIDKKSYKNIDIYCIGYITINDSDYINTHSVNSLYLIIGEADGYIDEKNGNKYLTFASRDKNKEVFKKYAKHWHGIKNETDTINGGKPGEYGKESMKVKFN